MFGGEHYRNDEWCSSETYDEDKLLCQIASVIEDINLGTYVHYDNYSISGDWLISSDYYFNKDNKLYFVFWRMNTYQAEETLTVEKRLYFNFDGEPIRTFQTKYKMNTISKSNASFADQNVEYESRLNRMGFYNTWKNK
ncbi:hypothetical protein ACJRPK_09615 [Aquimarina sp. 2-A2]|uniref:hypothetical protein n=1 Tax=Aquimarina sp. 2-A2 TaxID=3382644 RepID=UPI00387F1BFE